MTCNIEDVIDSMIDQAQAQYPGVVEWVISASEEQAPRLERHDHRLLREGPDGRMGEFRNVFVYRDMEVNSIKSVPWLVALGPLVDPSNPASRQAPTYYCDLRSGDISTTVPPDALIG